MYKRGWCKLMNNLEKALNDLKQDPKYYKNAEKLSNIVNGSNVYDKDGKTLSPFFIFNNQKLKFKDELGNIKTGKQVLKLNDEYVKTYSDYLTPNEINKLSFEDQIKRVSDPKSKEFHGKFWKKWSLIN